jgi:hypothetical protein
MVIGGCYRLHLTARKVSSGEPTRPVASRLLCYAKTDLGSGLRAASGTRLRMGTALVAS